MLLEMEVGRGVMRERTEGGRAAPPCSSPAGDWHAALSFSERRGAGLGSSLGDAGTYFGGCLTCGDVFSLEGSKALKGRCGDVMLTGRGILDLLPLLGLMDFSG